MPAKTPNTEPAATTRFRKIVAGGSLKTVRSNVKRGCDFVNVGRMGEIFFTAGVCMIAAGVCLGADPPASQVNLATGAAIRFGEARVDLHVAPAGDDAGTGDASTPLRTVGQARDGKP
jgi:hypothetical protein